MDYERLQRGGRERYLDRAVLAGRRYVRHGLLGQGTYSDVYCIEDGADGRRYACKVSWRAEMLEREAQVLKEVRHPLYPKFAAFWRAAGLGILLREYVSGRSLEEMLGRRHFSAAQTIRAGLELAAGLMYLHGLGEGLLFRDVKPGNIIVGQDGGLKLIDLGCVCPLGAEVASRAGSPGFAAPEQLRDGGVLSASCDVYGLGKTLEAMLGDGRARGGGAGRPGSGRLRESLLRAGKSGPGMGRAGRGWGIRRGPWPDRGPCRIGERERERKLRRILAACTEEEPGERMGDMGALVEELLKLSVWACPGRLKSPS